MVCLQGVSRFSFLIFISSKPKIPGQVFGLIDEENLNVIEAILQLVYMLLKLLNTQDILADFRLTYLGLFFFPHFPTTANV